MVTRVFDNIPEAQIERDEWQTNFKSLGERGRETTWGLLHVDRRILGLCVMLEESLAREAELSNVFNKNKGLQMENGRLRARLERLAGIATPAESESA